MERARALGFELGGLSDDYREPMTREQFRSIAMNYVAIQQRCNNWYLNDLLRLNMAEARLQGQVIIEFEDGDELDNLACYLGVVEGRGDGTFDPQGLITRQEAAVMLTRAYGACGGTLPAREDEPAFPDEGEIADWAIDSACALASWDVMKGMDTGLFAPEGQYSIEQCIVTFLRLCESAPVSLKNGNVTSLFTYEQCLNYISKDGDIVREAWRLEGPVATFLRMDAGGVMMAGSFFYLVHRDGGVQEVDLGVCNTSWGGFSPRVELGAPHFSEDGKTFHCTVTFEEDYISNWMTEELTLYHEKGIYHISIDVDTGKDSYVIEALPE